LIQPAGIGGGKAPQRSSVSKDPFVAPAYFRNSSSVKKRGELGSGMDREGVFDVARPGALA
jgi:hypothetical protein